MTEMRAVGTAKDSVGTSKDSGDTAEPYMCNVHPSHQRNEGDLQEDMRSRAPPPACIGMGRGCNRQIVVRRTKQWVTLMVIIHHSK